MSIFGVILVRIFPHSDWIRRNTPYLSVSVRMRENADQNNSEHGHFLRSNSKDLIFCLTCLIFLKSSWWPVWIFSAQTHLNFQINLLKVRIRKEHNKLFCGLSKIFKNISWPINICLKYLMPLYKPSAPPPPPPSFLPSDILNVQSLNSKVKKNHWLTGITGCNSWQCSPKDSNVTLSKVVQSPSTTETTQKMNFCVKDFFSKWEQICSFLKHYIFCALWKLRRVSRKFFVLAGFENWLDKWTAQVDWILHDHNIPEYELNTEAY